MQLQLKFFQRFFTWESDAKAKLERYFAERNNKYEYRNSLISSFEVSYFREWLAGFIESEGSFTSRTAGNYSFTIGQHNDRDLIQAIQRFYELDHIKVSSKIGKVSGYPFYEFSVGSVIGVSRVIVHCSKLLQGYQYYQLAVLVQKSKAFQYIKKEFF